MNMNNNNNNSWIHKPSLETLLDSSSPNTTIHLFAFNVCTSNKYPFLQVLLEKKHTDTDDTTTNNNNNNLLQLPSFTFTSDTDFETEAVQIVQSLVSPILQPLLITWIGLWYCETNDKRIALLSMEGDFTCFATWTRYATIDFALASEIANQNAVGPIGIDPELCQMVQYNPDLVRLYKDTEPETNPFPCPEPVFLACDSNEKSTFRLIFGPPKSYAWGTHLGPHHFFYRTIHRCNPEAHKYLNKFALFVDGNEILFVTEHDTTNILLQPSDIEQYNYVAILVVSPQNTLPDVLVKNYNDFISLTKYIL